MQCSWGAGLVKVYVANPRRVSGFFVFFFFFVPFKLYFLSVIKIFISTATRTRNTLRKFDIRGYTGPRNRIKYYNRILDFRRPVLNSLSRGAKNIYIPERSARVNDNGFFFFYFFFSFSSESNNAIITLYYYFIWKLFRSFRRFSRKIVMKISFFENGFSVRVRTAVLETFSKRLKWTANNWFRVLSITGCLDFERTNTTDSINLSAWNRFWFAIVQSCRQHTNFFILYVLYISRPYRTQYNFILLF